MKNDTTWEYTDNSEQKKQQAARSHGNLVGLQSKTPVPRSPFPAPHSRSKTPSPLRSKIIAHCSLCIAHLQGKLARLRSKTPFHFSRRKTPAHRSLLSAHPSFPIREETILTLLRRKDYLVRKLVILREGAVEEKAWIYREVNALTGVLDFIWLILKTVHYEQLEKLRNLQAIEDGLLPGTPDCVKIRIPGAPDSVREALAAYSEWRQR
jgi:hypothetical protein